MTSNNPILHAQPREYPHTLLNIGNYIQYQSVPESKGDKHGWYFRVDETIFGPFESEGEACKAIIFTKISLNARGPDMSVVTGVTLHTGHEERACLDKINEWLARRDFPELEWGIESHYGGNKHPQIRLYGSGYNYFPEDEFAKFFQNLIWDEPETVVLILNPEEAPARVYRPGDR